MKIEFVRDEGDSEDGVAGQEAVAGPSTPAARSTGVEEPLTAGPVAGLVGGVATPGVAAASSSPPEAAVLPGTELPALLGDGRQARASSPAGRGQEAVPAPVTPAGTSRSRSASRAGAEPGMYGDSRRSRQRVSAAAPSSAMHREIVKSLKDIGECVQTAEGPDQLFCSAIAAELEKQPEDVKRKMKSAICRVVYG